MSEGPFIKRAKERLLEVQQELEKAVAADVQDKQLISKLKAEVTRRKGHLLSVWKAENV